MKIAIYARVSTQEQAEGKFSIETQIEDCEKYCHHQGDTVVKCYTDIQSGQDAQKDREQFEQMLKDARSGLFDKIVVWKPDRLFRGLTPAAKLARTLDDTGISIEGVLQPIDRNMIGLWAWVAEQEIKSMKERLGAGRRARVKELGKWCGGGFIKYGCKYNSDKKSDNYTGNLEIGETEAKVVLTMFERVDNGETLSEVAHWANKEGIPTKRKGIGRVPQQISRMLRDRAYIGEGYYGKLARRGKKLVMGNNPISMPYPQIIPEDLFNRVQARLSLNKRRNSAGAQRTYMLQHLGRCGECGGTLCCQTTRQHRYLYCLRQQIYPHLHNCYQPKRWHLGLVEDYVWAEVEDMLDSYRQGTYGVLIDQFENSKEDREKQIARAKDELDRCSLERQRILTTIRKGWATETEAELQFAAVKSDEEYWQQELANLETLTTNIDAIWDSWWSQLKRIDAWFDYGFILTPEQKKEILNIMLDKFVLYKDGRIELRFKLPVNEKQVAETISTLSTNSKLFLPKCQ